MEGLIEQQKDFGNIPESQQEADEREYYDSLMMGVNHDEDASNYELSKDGEEDWLNIPYEEIYGDCDEYKVNYANYCQQYDSDNDYDDNYVSENAIRLQKQIDEYEYALEVQAMYDAEFGTKEQRDEELRQYRLYYARERAISRLQNQQEKNSALQKSV